METELKLELAREDAERLAASGFLGGPPIKVEQVSTYFDTPGRKLAKTGFSLRIRRIGETRVQTVKASGVKAAGLFARPEWEIPVGADLPVLDERTPLAGMFNDLSDLGPLFAVENDRRIWTIDHGESTVEVVLDTGQIAAGERRVPVCEIELEMKRGSVDDLFALARRIAGEVPVRPAVNSKSEAGYRLLGPAETHFKADDVQLTPGLSTAEAFQAIVGSCLRQYRLNETALLDNGNPEALHQARVGLRRMRSAFTIFKPVIADRHVETLRSELKWLAQLLGEARDLDVLVDRAADGQLRDMLRAERLRLHDALLVTLASERVHSLLFDVVEWLNAGAWLQSDDATHRDRPAEHFAALALERFRRRVKKKGKHLADLDEDHRHELRKDAKKLRYAAEFFHCLFDGGKQKRRYKKFVSALESLQDELGTLNDAVTARHVLARLGIADEQAARPLMKAKGRAKLLNAAADAHGDFVDARRFWD